VRGWAKGEAAGLALLAAAVAFGAIVLAPEVRIGRVPLNDSVFHLAAAERLGGSLARGEPFLDPWVSEWALGYPLWRTYQPLPHLMAAGFLRVTEGFVDHATAFAWLQYLLLVLLPASVYVGARLLGLSPPAAGLASLLVMAPSGEGELGRYGLGWGAFLWRGSGLYAQLVALHILVLAVGAIARALDSGRGRVTAVCLLALTPLSHLVFAYVALGTAVVLVLVGPLGRSLRLVRLVTLGAATLPLVAWFVVPLVLSAGEINHSRWEPAFKWDSFGPGVLSSLVSGDLLDAGRGPWLSLLVLAGALGAAASLREVLARRLLALAGLWLALFLGRAAWGHLLLLVGAPWDMPLHRLQAAFELAAVLLAAWGVTWGIRAAARAAPWLSAVLAAGVAACILFIGVERVGYADQDARWGAANLAAYERERPEVEAVLSDLGHILDERPGRVSAGLSSSWGKDFQVGDVSFYAFLTRAHLDQASFLYHALSSASDLMVLRREESRAEAVTYGVRAVVAPVDRPLPNLRRRAVHGRFAVYEASPEGYFGLADLGGRYTGPPDTRFEVGAAWLGGPLAASGIVIALDHVPGDALPEVGRWQPLPAPDPAFRAPCGRVVQETKEGETHRARLSLERPCQALFKATWYPDLVASVDGAPVRLRRVTPGFGAFAVPAGEHEVAVSYRPGPLKPALFLAGLALFACAVYLLRRPRLPGLEEALSRRIEKAMTPLATPRAATAGGLAAVTLLALRPLFRGRLIAGHDALAYPPRLVEFARAVAEGHLPPLWAADLGAGHGQPLFAFAPPLLYAVALPFHACGARLADALQLAVALLHAAGAAAVYRLGRRAGCSRPASAAGAAAWLFAPYTALDLFVRSAFAEAAAVAVAPIALLGLLRALDKPVATRIALGAVAVALIPLAHNGAALLLFPALAMVALASAFGRRSPRLLAAGAAVLGGGLGLSAFFWLPALIERGLVQTDLLRSDFLSFGEHAIAPVQLLWSRWGYGLSVPGTGDGMSFALGPAQLLLAFVGLVIAVRSRLPQRRAEAAALAAIAAGGAWLATDTSTWLWSRVEMLQYLAFPWRALLLPGLALPLLAHHAFERLGRRGAVAAAAVLVVLNLGHTEPKDYLTFDDEYYAPARIAEKGINTTTREEYTPRWVAERPAYSATPLAGLDHPVTILDQRRTSARQAYRVRAADDTRVEAATFYYPGWRVEVDRAEVAVGPAPRRGTMVFSLPAGEHSVTLAMGTTPPRRLGRWLSLVSAVLLLLVSLGPGILRRARVSRPRSP
jgi:hypothetical protein